MKTIVLATLALAALSACASRDAGGNRVMHERAVTAAINGASFGPCRQSDMSGCGGLFDRGAIAADAAAGRIVWVKRVDGGAFAQGVDGFAESR